MSAVTFDHFKEPTTVTSKKEHVIVVLERLRKTLSWATSAMIDFVPFIQKHIIIQMETSERGVAW